MTTAEAPAAWAFAAFKANVHVPRWMIAMAPAGKPAAQPLVDVLGVAAGGI